MRERRRDVCGAPVQERCSVAVPLVNCGGAPRQTALPASSDRWKVGAITFHDAPTLLSWLKTSALILRRRRVRRREPVLIRRATSAFSQQSSSGPRIRVMFVVR